MPLIPTVIENSKNNSQGYWFKKMPGQEFGYSPVTRQGRLVFRGYFILIAANVFTTIIPIKREIRMLTFIFILILLTVSFSYIVYKKREK